MPRTDPPGKGLYTESELEISETLLRTTRELLSEVGRGARGVALGADLERDLGLGSLERAELFGRFERAVGVRLPDRALVEAHTLEAVLELVGSGGTGEPIPRPARPEAGAAVEKSGVWRLPDRAETLTEVAAFRAEQDGERPYLTLLGDDGEETVVTFGGLWREALGVAESLAATGLARGDRVGMLLPTGKDFFVGFLGALAAGGVPVPMYPPLKVSGLAAYLERQSRLLDNAGARTLLTDGPLSRVGRLLADRVGHPLRVEEVAGMTAASPGLYSVGPVMGEPEDLGLIQYTSGSTGDPKGVAVSHRAALANIRAVGVAVELGPSDVVVNWLPLYHDMGLIGSWWTSLYHGIPSVMLSPLAFLLRPERWLWTIHRFGGTTSPAPTFAYDLCAHKIPDAALEGLDLSSWRAAMVGAESVREETLEAFHRRFAPHGLRRQALMPVYGMAETALGLTVTPPGRGPVIDRVEREALLEDRRAVPAEEGAGETLAVVGCGRPLPGHEVRVVDRDDPERELPERAEGRIHFRGPSTMEGYFRAPEATAAVRRGEWIDTGDLGYLAGGEIHVTGRLKDLIIKGGRNYHPHDLERAAQRVPGVRKGCVVAFDAPGQRGETMVLVAETREPPARHGKILQAVDEAVADAVGIPPDRVVLVPPRVLPKTSSGKLQRRRARDLYLEGRLGRRQRAGWRELAAVAIPSVRRRLGGVRRVVGFVGRLLYTSWVVVVTLGVLCPGTLLVMTRRADPGRWRTARGTLRLWGRLLGLLPRVTGSPPARGGLVVISNHGSYVDAFVLIMASERPLAFASKSEVFDWPLAGAVMRHMNHVPVDRSTHEARLRGSEEVRRRLRRGEAIQIFPEATFTPRAGLRPFRLGAFSLAAETGAALVPVVLRGTRRVLRDGHRLLSRSPLRVDFLEPVELPEDAAFSDLVRLRDSLRRTLSEALDEPLLEELNP